MKTFVIIRTHRLPYGVFGVMSYLGEPFCLTAERPWKGNKRGISCIPAGIYDAALIASPTRGYAVYELIGVPGRTHIQLHIGNYPMKDSEGCILTGESFIKVGTQVAIGDSRGAFREFMGLGGGDRQIRIRIAWSRK